MGQCGGHLGSIPYRRLPPRPPGEACPETPWKTPAAVASSRQEPLTGGGLCHEFSLCGSLRSPPEGTLTWVLTFIRTSFPIYPVPETDYLHRCFSLTLIYLSCSPHNLTAKSCFAMLTFPSVFPVFDYPLPTWTVYPLMKELCLPKLTLPALLICYIVCLPPALIFSLNTVYDSVLPTWYLTPVIDICLSDLPCEVIKLQMDPNDTASSLHYYCWDSKSTSGHFIIPVGHRIGVVNGSEVTQLTPWVTWQWQYCQM